MWKAILLVAICFNFVRAYEENSQLSSLRSFVEKVKKEIELNSLQQLVRKSLMKRENYDSQLPIWLDEEREYFDGYLPVEQITIIGKDGAFATKHSGGLNVPLTDPQRELIVEKMKANDVGFFMGIVLHIEGGHFQYVATHDSVIFYYDPRRGYMAIGKSGNGIVIVRADLTKNAQNMFVFIQRIGRHIQ
ncbi:DgyrCDS14469 [Dimorphilus gyrociliatus]|uniref:DgyrCDS14469 n=1 Tax=Dimorphilus gyrociliatus TaxID=2664684 RepID=A0A7I8WDR4_9ANNE|nr:DgyrCDS14469 [Dimorphilus gyrociliatus]